MAALVALINTRLLYMNTLPMWNSLASLYYYCDIIIMHQSMWITRVPPLQADPGDSDIWNFLLYKFPPSFAPFVSESHLFATPLGGKYQWDIRKLSVSPGLPMCPPHRIHSNWCITNSNSSHFRLPKLLNRSARLILKLDLRSHVVDDMFRDLMWVDVKERHELHTAVMVYKVKNA